MIGQLYTLIVMALALGMDAFSVSLSVGLLKLRLKQIFYIGLMTGFFHILMPLIGMLTGQFLSDKFDLIAAIIGGVLLTGLGLQMIFSSFLKDDKLVIAPVGFGLLIFSLTVSIDSLAVGLSLGIYGVKVIIALACFGIVTTVLTWLGLLLSRNTKDLLGNYSLAFGGTIMLAFGLKLLFL